MGGLLTLGSWVRQFPEINVRLPIFFFILRAVYFLDMS